MFVDRQRETRDLESLLDHPTPQLIRVYGRRRIGKTELLRNLVRDATGIFLTADEADRRLQLESMSDQLAQQTRSLRRPYRSWDALLDHLEEVAPRVIVFDEFQRILSTDPQAVTRLQARWDARWRVSGPNVILCGSSIGMMQRLTEGRRGPLYGRLTGNLHLLPFDYQGVRLLYPTSSEEERIRRYAVFGGTPFYHTFSQGLSLEASVKRAFLDRTAPLADEPQDLLRFELQSPTRHNSILYEIGQGIHRLSDLESRVGVQKGGLGPYLEILRDDLDLIEMETPVCGVKRPARYVFRDPFFEFYYRFVFARRPQLELGRTDAVWRQIAADLEGHVGRVFERVVRNAFRLAQGRQIAGLPVEITEMGRWWNRTGAEIDLVVRGRHEVWAGEVKWGTHPVGPEVVHELVEKLPLLERTDNLPVRPFVVARNGLSSAGNLELRRVQGFSLDLAGLDRLFDQAAP